MSFIETTVWPSLALNRFRISKIAHLIQKIKKSFAKN